MDIETAESSQSVTNGSNAEQRGNFLLLLYAFTLAQNMNDDGGSFATDIHRYISRFYSRASLETTSRNLEWLCRKSPAYMYRVTEGVDGGGENRSNGYRYTANQGLQNEQLLELIITEDIADNLDTLEGMADIHDGIEYIDFSIATDDDHYGGEIEIAHFSEQGDVVIECDLATAERLLEEPIDDEGVETLDNEADNEAVLNMSDELSHDSILYIDVQDELSDDSILYIDVEDELSDDSILYIDVETAHLLQMNDYDDFDITALETLNLEASSLELALQITGESLGFDVASDKRFLQGPERSEEWNTVSGESSDDQEDSSLTESEEDPML